MPINPSEIPRGNISGNWACTITISPASVAPNTTAEQTFAIGGLIVGDYVEVNKPTHQGGLGITNTRVSANGVLAIAFVNATASTITPTASELYLMNVTRAVNVSQAGSPTLTSIPT
jgi:hypothetical protein